MKLFLSDMTNLAHSSLRTCLVVARVKMALHARVNFRESYREYLATMLKRESKWWRAGSLRGLWEHRTCETSQSTKFSFTLAS